MKAKFISVGEDRAFESIDIHNYEFQDSQLATLTLGKSIEKFKVYKIEGGNDVMGFIMLPREANIDSGKIKITYQKETSNE